MLTDARPSGSARTSCNSSSIGTESPVPPFGRMQRRELVRRKECGEDGRGAYIALTKPPGRRSPRPPRPRRNRPAPVLRRVDPGQLAGLREARPGPRSHRQTETQSRKRISRWRRRSAAKRCGTRPTPLPSPGHEARTRRLRRGHARHRRLHRAVHAAGVRRHRAAHQRPTIVESNGRSSSYAGSTTSTPGSPTRPARSPTSRPSAPTPSGWYSAEAAGPRTPPAT